MGYYRPFEGADFRIASANVAKALLAGYRAYYEAEPEPADNVEECVLEGLGGYYSAFTRDPAGNITDIEFGDDRISYDQDSNEKSIFGAMAPFVVAGSFIEFGAYEGFGPSRWVFDGKTVKDVAATITW
jgi:hypothetical protein